MSTTPRIDRAGGSQIAALVRDRVLDTEFCALLWVLLDARIPVTAVGHPGSGRQRVVEGLRALLPAAAVCHAVAGSREDFAWLPEAAELGWRSEGGRPGAADGAHADPVDVAQVGPGNGVLVVRDLGDGPAGGPAGAQARIVVRALALGYGLLATAPGDSLDDVLEMLHAPAIGTDADERSRLGVILVMGHPGTVAGAGQGPGSSPSRVVAAHYVRPVSLDTHGHVQRPAPAVLATWNDGADRWDHFAWGLLPDLAGRTGRKPIEFEQEQVRREAALRDLMASGD